MTGKRNHGSPVGSPTSGYISDSSSREQDRFLPIANVSRIMKKSLPANAKISKEAKETVQECVSEFISFITGEASDKCQREKRKTINGDDLLWAMTTLGFENYIGPLKVYLNRYREIEGEKNSSFPKPEDQSPVATNEVVVKETAADFEQRFGSGSEFFSVFPLSYGYGERAVNNRENLVAASSGFNVDRIRRSGDGNGYRPMTAHLRHDVEW
ncbi:hypothetical protein SLA2020_410840 [Shorea laevis]